MRDPMWRRLIDTKYGWPGAGRAVVGYKVDSRTRLIQGEPVVDMEPTKREPAARYLLRRNEEQDNWGVWDTHAEEWASGHGSRGEAERWLAATIKQHGRPLGFWWLNS